MHLVILTAGQGGALSTQHVYHGATPRASAGLVHLLVLDSRHMSPACFASATQAVNEIRARHGLQHGVLLSSQRPALPVVIAAIRCGLRDLITPHLGAAHLRRVLRSAVPSLGSREFRDAVGFLRTFGGFADSSEPGDARVGRRLEELNRRAEALAEQEKALALEKERLNRAEADLRERTRRLDRQLARLQNDADVLPAGHTNSPFPSAASSQSAAPLPPSEQAALARRLEQRAAELDVREKLLNEMQALLLATPQGANLAKAPMAGAASPASPRPLARASA